MKPLVTNQQVLTWLCVLPADESTSKRQKIAYIAFTVAVFTMLLTLVGASVAFFAKNFHTNLEQSLYSLLQIAAVSTLLYSITVALLSWQKITSLLRKLTEIYNIYKDENSFRYLAQANNTSEWMWKIYIKFIMRGFIICHSTFSVISVLICWLTGNFDVANFYHPCKLILPWDQSTLIGYVGEICYVIFFAVAYLIANGSFLLLFVSICFHIEAFYKMFRLEVRQFDGIDNKNRNDKELLCKIIQFHITTKDWFLEATELYSPFILIQMVSAIIILACVVFQCDMQTKHPEFSFVLMIMSFLYGTSMAFLYCYFGKLATESFEKMAVCLYECNWQDLPIDLQKYFILMIANTQKPIHFHGFGMVKLDLETFCALLRAVYSYYMMFKTLTTD